MRYPHIRISSYSTHCKCDICTKLQTERENIKNVQEREDCRLKIEAHSRKFRGARRAITKKLQQAISLPRDVLGISLDDMDNSKSLIPRIIESGKSLSQLVKLE